MTTKPVPTNPGPAVPVETLSKMKVVCVHSTMENEVVTLDTDPGSLSATDAARISFKKGHPLFGKVRPGDSFDFFGAHSIAAPGGANDPANPATDPATSGSEPPSAHGLGIAPEPAGAADGVTPNGTAHIATS